MYGEFFNHPHESCLFWGIWVVMGFLNLEMAFGCLSSCWKRVKMLNLFVLAETYFKFQFVFGTLFLWFEVCLVVFKVAGPCGKFLLFFWNLLLFYFELSFFFFFFKSFSFDFRIFIFFCGLNLGKPIGTNLTLAMGNAHKSWKSQKMRGSNFNDSICWN